MPQSKETVLSCIGKSYAYQVDLYYDGHKKPTHFIGTCIGYDPKPPGRPPGHYLVMRVHTDVLSNGPYHTVPIKEVKEVISNVQAKPQAPTTTHPSPFKQEPQRA